MIANVGEEESASGLGSEESPILRSRKFEVAVNVAALESEIQDLLLPVVRHRGEHFRFDSHPGHPRSPCLILNRVHDFPIVDTIPIEVILTIMPPPSRREPQETSSREATPRSG